MDLGGNNISQSLCGLRVVECPALEEGGVVVDRYKITHTAKQNICQHSNLYSILNSTLNSSLNLRSDQRSLQNEIRLFPRLGNCEP